MPTRFGTTGAISGPVVAMILVAVSSCANAPYQERMDYLRTVAQRGADTHALLDAQGAAIDRKRCEKAFDGLQATDEPGISDGGSYHEQVVQFFVDSCVSGRPKPVPGQPVPASPTAGIPAPSAS